MLSRASLEHLTGFINTTPAHAPETKSEENEAVSIEGTKPVLKMTYRAKRFGMETFSESEKCFLPFQKLLPEGHIQMVCIQ